MLQLSITIDDQSGFCFGVVYAIEMAEEILDREGHLYCLGDIVHNDEEIARLQKKGLKIITFEEMKTLYNDRVLIRAHGEPPATYRLAMDNKLELIDASCPVVLKLQNRIRNSFERGEHIYIYGKKGHAEVEGLLGQTLNTATVFENIENLDLANPPRQITLYSQTTKSTHNFYKMAEHLRASGVEVDAHDTICRQVSNRDAELQRFATGFDKVVFVAGAKSSNGKVLFNVCQGANPATYFVSSCKDIQADWFVQGDTVGVCGATSTPRWLMEEVRTCLEKL